MENGRWKFLYRKFSSAFTESRDASGLPYMELEVREHVRFSRSAPRNLVLMFSTSTSKFS